MGVRVVVAPTALPLTLEETKRHLRVDHCEDDVLILALIEAGTSYAENFTGRALIDRTLDFSFDAFPDSDGVIELPKPPLIEVVGVFYPPDDQQFDAFEIDRGGENMPARLYLSNGSWPSSSAPINAGWVRYRAGYVDVTDPELAAVPAPIKAAILMYIGTLYRFRETLQTDEAHLVPWGAELMLRQYRVEKALA